jgi:hypothetical protein
LHRDGRTTSEVQRSLPNIQTYPFTYSEFV